MIKFIASRRPRRVRHVEFRQCISKLAFDWLIRIQILTNQIDVKITLRMITIVIVMATVTYRSLQTESLATPCCLGRFTTREIDQMFWTS